MDPLDKVEFVVPPPYFGAGPGVQAGGGLGVCVPQDVAVEAVDGLTLILGGFELGRVQPECVVRTAGVLRVRSVHQSTGASPAPVDKLLIELRGQGCRYGIIGITCRHVLDMALNSNRGGDYEVWRTPNPRPG